MSRFLAFAALACACLSCFAAQSAQASTFDVSPISLTLSAKVTSGMLTVTNRGTEAVRFQVSSFAWDQNPKGEMVLNPTKDIVFFPALMELKPGEARKLRVGMNIRPEAVEKSYRIFVQELPPLAGANEAGAVRVLTKMGIPIYIEPDAPKLVAGIGPIATAAGKITFQLRNTGNVHFRPDKVVTTAKDASGKVVHTEEVTGWYVLAGGVRDYVVELPKDACLALKSVQVELQMEKGGTKAALADAHCAP